MKKITIEKAREVLAGSPIGKTGLWCKSEGFIEGFESREAEIKQLAEKLGDKYFNEVMLCMKAEVKRLREALKKIGRKYPLSIEIDEIVEEALSLKLEEPSTDCRQTK